MSEKPLRVGTGAEPASRPTQEQLLALAKRQHHLDQLALLRTFNAEVNNRQVRRHYARIMEKRNANAR